MEYVDKFGFSTVIVGLPVDLHEGLVSRVMHTEVCIIFLIPCSDECLWAYRPIIAELLGFGQIKLCYRFTLV